MSYLNDPRVFLAAERTQLAWIRTEISILALIFVFKKYGPSTIQNSSLSIDILIQLICFVVVALSIISFLQIVITVKKLSPEEIPSQLSKFSVYATGIISIFLTICGSLVVLSIP